jgi:hypothetical protein
MTASVAKRMATRLLAAGGLLATLLLPASVGATGAAPASSRTATIPDVTVLFGCSTVHRRRGSER